MELLSAFSLTLMVNHACNLRCNYCYTGSKFNRRMLPGMGDKAIRRALASTKMGGRLDLGFFGGEPLIEAGRIREWIQYANIIAFKWDVEIRPHLTTNATILTAEAQALLFDPGVELAVSCDGAAATHDHHRRQPDGTGSAAVVHQTIAELVARGREFEVIMVVRPDTVSDLPANLDSLRAMGVRRFNISLDLWTEWNQRDAARLETAVEAAGRFWRAELPNVAINLFDTKLARLVGAPATEEVTLCGFGHGEVAVAPSGRLYPCERLIADDAEDNPTRLPGDIHHGVDFLNLSPADERNAKACNSCAIRNACSTTCRCSNYVRTGDVSRPDGLLCLLDKCSFQEAFKLISQPHDNTEHTHHERIQKEPIRSHPQLP